MSSIVFVVDDDASMRTAISRLLKSADFTPVVFASSEEFLQAQRPNSPSCLILDVRMPRMTGLELQQSLARIDPDLPIIFVTGHADVRMAVGAMKRGAIEFLSKPFEDHELLAAVQQATALHEQALIRRAANSAAAARLATLSPRERDVLVRVITGMLNKEIGYELGITEKTVKAHRGRVMEKMGAGSLPELVRIAQRAGITPVHEAVRTER